MEDYIDGRRRKKREEKARELSLKYAKENTDVASKFSDAKKRLADVSLEDWLSLPEAQDLVKMNRKKRSDFQRYTPVPDSVLASASGEGPLASQIDPSAAEMHEPGHAAGIMSTAAGASTDGVDASLRQIGEARQKLFSIELDRVQEKEKIGTMTSINKKGYMTDLDSMKINSETEINDLKKARALLKAVISSNPKSTSGWIAAARIEELDGKIQEARNILDQAC